MALISTKCFHAQTTSLSWIFCVFNQCKSKKVILRIIARHFFFCLDESPERKFGKISCHKTVQEEEKEERNREKSHLLQDFQKILQDFEVILQDFGEDLQEF